MEIAPVLGYIVTIVIAFGGFYGMVSASLAKLETLIADLRRDVEKHNQVIERTYALEADMKAVQTDINNIYHKFDDFKVGGTD